jgi:hypothetical protein
MFIVKKLQWILVKLWVQHCQSFDARMNDFQQYNRVFHKVRKASTRSLSWVQNRLRSLNPKPTKKYISLQGGRWNSEMHHFLCQTEFHPVLIPSFLFPERLHCCYIYFHCSYMYNYYTCLKPYSLNAEFQHFIPKFNKTSALCAPQSKRGSGVKRGPKTW